MLSRVRTGPGKPGKSWNLIIWIPGLESRGILAQVLEFHVGKFVCSRTAYCSGLSDMHAGKNIKLRQYVIYRSVCGTSQFTGSFGPVPYTLHVFNGVKLVFRLSLSLPRKIVIITFMHCKAAVRIKVG